MEQDDMKVLMDKTGAGFAGKNVVSFWRIGIHFSNGQGGVLAQGPGQADVLDHAIARAETLLAGLRNMKQEARQ